MKREGIKPAYNYLYLFIKEMFRLETLQIFYEICFHVNFVCWIKYPHSPLFCPLENSIISKHGKIISQTWIQITKLSSFKNFLRAVTQWPFQFFFFFFEFANSKSFKFACCLECFRLPIALNLVKDALF